MKAYVFTGPTLPAEAARVELDAVYLPPASQGDVYRVTLRKPQAIGIIDGYFECIPAVWHKEILWAMSQGIHVFGCSSMGALRAAELAPFGMEGVGKIFEAYQRGTIEDDDEVAVAHAPVGRGYLAASTAMVNIRATLAAAQAGGIIGRTARTKLERVAKQIPYQERSYAAMFERAGALGRSPSVKALARWLPTGQVDQKREDAVAMLQLMRSRLEAGMSPKRVEFSFEYTANWEVASASAGSLHLDAEERPATLLADRLLDELRLEGEACEPARQAALLRLLALEEAWRQGLAPAAQAIAAAARRFRQERGLEQGKKLEDWLRENQMNDEEFMELAKEEATLELLRELCETQAAAHVPALLRLHGDYARLASRARKKEMALESEGLRFPSTRDAGVTDEDLVRWYFEERLRRPVAVDIARYARVAGFADESSFRRAILREYCYTGLVRNGSGVG
jgi:AraC-like DNA-binding protein